MGAIADDFVALPQPLLDQTDGSLEEMQWALSLTQASYNLSLLSPAVRPEMLRKLQLSMEMDDAEFADLQKNVIEPMIERCEGAMPRRSS